MNYIMLKSFPNMLPLVFINGLNIKPSCTHNCRFIFVPFVMY